MAPGTYHLVLRNVRARTLRARLCAVSSGVSRAVQQLLRRRRRQAPAAAARSGHAPVARPGHGLPHCGGRPHDGLARAGHARRSRGARRARIAARAAAPGVTAHRCQTPPVVQSAGARLPACAPGPCRCGSLTAVDAFRRRRGRDRLRRRGLCVRQRDAAASAIPAAVRAVEPPRHAGAVVRLHCRRRLRRAALVVVRRLGLGAHATHRGTPVLATRRRGVVRVHAARPGADRSAHTGGARELLRGRRLRALARRAGRLAAAAANRGRVGARRRARTRRHAASRQLHGIRRAAPNAATTRRRRPRADVRRHVGVDEQRLRTVSGVPHLGGPGGRIQRQVHGQPVRAARRLVRHAALAHPGELPQLLPCGRPLAVQRRAAGLQHRGPAAPRVLSASRPASRRAAPTRCRADAGDRSCTRGRRSSR